MFSGILDHFNDFPKTEITFYAPTSAYNPLTGVYTETMEVDYSIYAWGFQKSAMKGIVSEKVWDDIDMVFIFDQQYAPDEENVILHNGKWYKIKFPDNVGFDDTVCVVGAQRIEEPVIA